MFTALASLMTNRPVRKEVAMTGEITLRGLVLPIGGLKEKTLAAKRAGITDVIIPRRNGKGLVDVPEEVRESLRFHRVDHVDEVLDIALQQKRVATTAETVRKATKQAKRAGATAKSKTSAKKTSRRRPVASR